MSLAGRKLPAIPADAAYIRGDGCAGAYLGFRDKAGRAFRQWAKERKIPYALINGIPVYRIADLDKAWKASVQHIFVS